MGNIIQMPIIDATPSPVPKAETKLKRRQRKAAPAPARVKLIRLERAGGITWAARYTDPRTGKVKQESLAREYGITEEGAARVWAENKAAALRDVHKAISAGEEVTTQTTVAEAVKAFVKAKKGDDAKPATLTVYEEATRPFTAWAAQQGLAHVEELTEAKLAEFRDWLVAQPAYQQAKKHGMGKGKSARVAGKRKPSAQTINKKLRAMRTVAGFWRQRKLAPRLTTDNIRDALKFKKAKKAAPAFMRPPEIRKLLEAVARHDAQEIDKRQNHPPIGDFLIAALLSGMRFSELATLKWSAVDLDTAEIRLTENDTKTKQARDVELDVSPALHALLTRRKLQAGSARFVFGPMRRDVAESARKRLVKDYDAPAFYWHLLRKTAGTYLACAPGIYRGASIYMAAKRAGHSVKIAETHYCGMQRRIPAEANTLEKAMGVDDLLPAPINQHEGKGAKRG